MKYHCLTAIVLSGALITALPATGKDFVNYTFEAGHSSLQEWILPATPPHPKDNPPTAERVALGKMLFFDTRLSGDGNMSCATCHSPLYGWSDALKTAKGFKSEVLGRASPTIINTAYNTIQMWDGRKKTLEDQAMGPMQSSVEMNMDIPGLVSYLNNEPGYKQAFDKAYPREEISEDVISKAIASFERTIISNDSPFDNWIAGDKSALSEHEIEGFKLFLDPEKGNCASCHMSPNFSDDGFHNVGLAAWGNKSPDVGRYAQKPIGLMKGAFKTPTLRDITLTAPYFHDGSAATLNDVVNHYSLGGIVKTNLSPNMKDLNLSPEEQLAIVNFMTTLTSPHANFVMPKLPPQRYAGSR